MYRRLDEEGVSRHTRYTEISDADLDIVIEEIKRNHHNDGERLLIGHLAAQGIIVARACVRASIHRVDPVNTALRRSVTVRRRVYHAAGPNAVWHVDGHHKLIRWRFVVHGGIDGYSRTIVYLSCSDNNRACTVLSSFMGAVQLHGLPNRLRSDLGGENVEVWRYMVEQHASADAVITGSSTHNERIERLWRDVFRCVGVLFVDTFRKLEEDGVLDCLNEIDLYCLHFVYLPRIESALDAFVDSWNNHSLSTEHNLTPNQLFIRGAIEQNMMPQQPPPPQTLAPINPGQPVQSDHVSVPRFTFAPCNTLCHLLSTINPVEDSENFGCDIYMQVVDIVGHHLSCGCNYCTD